MAAGPSGWPTAKRRSSSATSSVLRRRIFAQAAALFSARRERSAPAAGGSVRRAASRKASAAPAENSGSPCPALPLARAQAGIGEGAEKAWFSGASPRSASRVQAAGAAHRRGPDCLERGRPAARDWRNHGGIINFVPRLVTFCGKESALLVVGWACPISFHYRGYDSVLEQLVMGRARSAGASQFVPERCA